MGALPTPTKKRGGRRSPELQLWTSAYPVRVIVHDFDVGVNEYEGFGKNPPFWKPEVCPLCRRPGLKGHGLRRRSVWRRGQASSIIVFVRRLRCVGCPQARFGARSATFTVLPNFVHQFKRYLLADVEDIVTQRILGEQSFATLERANPEPAGWTQRSWCLGFERASPLWLRALSLWLTPRTPVALVRSVAEDHAVGLLAMAVQALSVWSPALSLPPQQVLVPLWTWGARSGGCALLPPTRSRAVARAPTG